MCKSGAEIGSLAASQPCIVGLLSGYSAVADVCIVFNGP